MLIIINKIFILPAYCQLIGKGRWQVALTLSFSGLAMCGILYTFGLAYLIYLMLMSLHTERRSGFMKWLCNFLKGPKPGEPNRRRSQVTAGEEEDALWHQRPVRPKVLHCTSNLVPPFLYNSSLSPNGSLIYPHSAVSHFYIQFNLHLLSHANNCSTKFRKSIPSLKKFRNICPKLLR